MLYGWDWMNEAPSALTTIIAVMSYIVLIVAEWELFEKAGEAGWKSLVPFYNKYVWYRIAMGNGWLFLLGLIPVVGWAVKVIACYKLSQAFGHGVLFCVGLFMLPFVFEIYLAFGPDEYYRPYGTGSF